MGDKSKIEWTDATWNPIRARNNETGAVGWFCEHASPGCSHCYAEGMNRWRGNGVDFKHQNRDLVTLFLDLTMLTMPLRWKRPRRIFPCSMTDLFGEFVSDAMIDEVLAIAVLAPRHTLQILTKRSARARRYFSCGPSLGLFDAIMRLNPNYNDDRPPITFGWPLPNVWLGVSVEDQQRADERIPDLLATPAEKRFLSCEPLLGPIDLDPQWRRASPSSAFLSGKVTPEMPAWTRIGAHAIDWVIAGGESGPGARPSHPEWFRSLRDQCAEVGISFFFKQWGDWHEFDHGSPDHEVDVGGELAAAYIAGIKPGWITRTGEFFLKAEELPVGVPCRQMERVGKALAGASLDGREHREFPA